MTNPQSEIHLVNIMFFVFKFHIITLETLLPTNKSQLPQAPTLYKSITIFLGNEV